MYLLVSYWYHCITISYPSIFHIMFVYKLEEYFHIIMHVILQFCRTLNTNNILTCWYSTKTRIHLFSICMFVVDNLCRSHIFNIKIMHYNLQEGMIIITSCVEHQTQTKYKFSFSMLHSNATIVILTLFPSGIRLCQMWCLMSTLRVKRSTSHAPLFNLDNKEDYFKSNPKKIILTTCLSLTYVWNFAFLGTCKKTFVL
jgi:hypothetical protein